MWWTIPVCTLGQGQEEDVGPGADATKKRRFTG